MIRATPRRGDRALRLQGRGGSFQAAHRVRLHEPRIDGSDVLFSWDVTPRTELYRRTDFRMSFPSQLELRKVPAALWWRVLMICLHTHWALLRPCQVELPVSLGAAEREFWLRLTDNVTVQLEAYGGTRRSGRPVQLVDSGPLLPPVRLPTAGDRVVAAFSGGKDSLVLSALLTELGQRPLLVSVTSPVSWARDHVGTARERARAGVARRLQLETVEVRSDYRTAWDHEFSGREGCRLGVHELSDLTLYYAAMIGVAASTGIGQLLMASEADLQYNAASDGHVILHPEFLSCAATQSALDALLRRFGLRQSSLTFPLHMPQVQGLLLRRYRELAGLQYSCWRAPPGSQACSACEKCFQIALVSLAEGVSPSALGIDPAAVLCAFGDWRLDAPQRKPALHPVRSARHHIVRSLQELSTESTASILARTTDDRRFGEALAIYARLRADALTQAIPPSPGYISGFLEFVPSGVRDQLRAIFDQHFSPAPIEEFAATVQRSRRLARWTAQPLSARVLGS